MDTLRALCLMIWLSHSAFEGPTIHTSHHVDEPVEIHILHRYGTITLG